MSSSKFLTDAELAEIEKDLGPKFVGYLLIAELRTARAELTNQRDHYVHDRILPLERELETVKGERDSWKLNAEIASEAFGDAEVELNTARGLLMEASVYIYKRSIQRPEFMPRIDAFLDGGK